MVLLPPEVLSAADSGDDDGGEAAVWLLLFCEEAGAVFSLAFKVVPNDLFLLSEAELLSPIFSAQAAASVIFVPLPLFILP